MLHRKVAGKIEKIREDAYIQFNLPAPESVTAEKINSLPETAVERRDQPEIIPWGIERINAPKAWDITQGAGVKVAVMDTGMDIYHPDLTDNIKGGINIVEPGRPPNDDNGHGTHVAGTIAAAKNGYGVIGTAPKASLYAVKVLTSNGKTSLSFLLEGVNWCINNKMDVINMSFGGTEDMPEFRAAVLNAYEAGIIIIAAAGNYSQSEALYPAAYYPQVIAVSAINQQDAVMGFSNSGYPVAFTAPGDRIHSTFGNGNYTMMSGTSMSAPHISGLAALAISRGITGCNNVRQAMQSAAVPLPGYSARQQGWGVVNAETLVKQ